MALTDTQIRKAKSKDKAHRMSDGGGLYLWVTPAGGKLWRWKYRHDGQEKLMSFGKYPNVPLVLVRERHGEPQAPGCWDGPDGTAEGREDRREGRH
jgi:hypothetical protein